MDLEKSDIYIDGYGFRVSSLSRRQANDFAPKFNTGADSENDLTLLKSKSVSSFIGGSFQEDHLDPDKVDFIEGASVDYETGHLLPNWLKDTHVIDSITGTNIGYPLHTCTFNDLVFLATADMSVNHIYTISTGGTVTELTLPSALSNADPITDIFASNRHVWVATGTESGGVTVYRSTYPYDGTFTALGSTKGDKFAYAGKDRFYMFSAGAMKTYQGSGVWADIERFQHVDDGEVNSTASLNGVPYLGTPEGLYLYDGAKLDLVIDYKHSYNSDNFKYMVSWRGWLYYTIGDQIWRFNGATVEKIIDTERVYNITSLSASADSVWFTTALISGNATDDKYGTANEYSLWRYDGVGTFRFAYYTDTGYDSLQVTSVSNGGSVYLIYGGITINTVTADNYVALEYDIDGALTQDNTSSETPFSMTVTTSWDDMGLPSVDKTFHEIEVVLGRNNRDLAGDIIVKVEDDNGTVNTVTHTTASSNEMLKYSLTYGLDGNQSEVIGRKISVTYYSASGDWVELESIIIRYTINTPNRYVWTATIPLANSTKQNPNLTDTNGDIANITADEFTNRLMKALLNPEGFELVIPTQYTYFPYSVSDSATGNVSITTRDLISLPHKGYLRCQDEIMQYRVDYAVAHDFVDLEYRGAHGTTAQSHTTSDKVYHSKHVYGRIVRQNYIYHENTDTSGGQESEVMVEFTEV